jgi:hypothetical protein
LGGDQRRHQGHDRSLIEGIGTVLGRLEALGHGSPRSGGTSQLINFLLVQLVRSAQLRVGMTTMTPPGAHERSSSRDLPG